MRILHVDDHLEHRRHLRALLTERGVEVVWASNGVEALDLLTRERIDVIIADVLMPQMDGFELCRAVKAHPRWQRIPFVMLTATHTDPADEERALGLGADRFLEQPADPEVLLRAITDLGSRRRARQTPTHRETPSTPDERVFLKAYNERLVRELEEKVGELQALSRTLQSTLADKERELAERLRMEAALRESEARYRVTSEQTGKVIYDYDVPSGRIEWFGAIERVTGFSAGEFQAVDMARWTAMVHAEDRSTTLALLEDARLRCGSFAAEYRFARKDGSYVTVEDQGVFLPDESGEAARMFGSIGDITVRRAAQNAMHQAQKLEAVGTLAGGIAHELNNVLTVVLTNASLLQSELGARNDDSRTCLTEMEMAVRRGSSMIRRLLAFARHEKVNARPERIDKIVSEAADTLRRLIPANIEIRTESRRETPQIMADADAVEQMLFNLATNARDAMPDGGTLTIAVDRVRVSHGDPESSLGAPGEYVALSVIDTGTGMDESTLARATEPFFTTKPAGEGTGLGLAMVFGLMQQHRGFLSLTSRPGHGTTIRLFFPIRAVSPSDKTPPGAPRGGTETILVVEDEPFLRSVAERSLRRLGYTVLTAVDGEEGLRVFLENTARIALIFSDAVMPRMGGVELLEALRSRGATVPFVLTSGYSERDLRAVQGRSAPVLQKPWSLEDLASVVRTVLDEAPGPGS